MPAYVKFSRGLISTYNHLTKKDPDTLYLVYETKDSDDGLLYLGDKLISQVGGDFQLSLNDLTNVNIDNSTLEDGMLLQYNNSTENGKWQAVRLSNISSSSNISIIDSLNEISNAKEKDIAIVGQDVFIYHNNGWNRLTDSSLIDRVNSLELKVGEKANGSTASTGIYKEIEDLRLNTYTKEEINNLEHLSYQIVESIEDIDIENSSNNIIYLVRNNNAEENNEFDEYSIIDGALEKIGYSNIDLTNYVTTNDSRLLSEEQKNKINSLGINSNNQATIQAAQVEGLTQAIQNGQIIKSVSPASFNLTPEGQLQLKATPSIDLSDYVKVNVFNETVGDLNTLFQRSSANSTLVDEINIIKQNLIWQELLNN